MSETLKRVPHKHVHSSGRYDRTVEQVRAGMIRYMKDEAADVITLTEQGRQSHRAEIRQRAAELGYTVHQGPGGNDDSVVLLREKRFWTRAVWHDELSPLPQNRATGGPIHQAVTVLAEDLAGGVPILYTVAHLTAGVEAQWANDAAYRVRLWRSAHSTWSTLTSARRRQYGVRVAMVADWNLNLEKALYRALLKSLHPRLTLTWQQYPGPGTLGGRVIDATLTNLQVQTAATLMADDDFADHRPYSEALA